MTPISPSSCDLRVAALSSCLRTWLLSALLFTGLLVTGCGGDSNGDSGSAADTGEVVIALTDADGDFATYTVDVVSLTLKRADGAVVQTLPINARVDFAQYTELTEFLTAATVPSGIYAQVDMTLDFANADIRAMSGHDTVPLAALDTDGNLLTNLTVHVKLDGHKALIVRPGLPAILTLDFDLEATNVVDLANETVTVAPLLLADVEANPSRIHRARGPLARVELAKSQYIVAIRPFHLRHGDYGRLTVKTDADTMFEIDRIPYKGAAGLAVLETKPAGTATVAAGYLNIFSHTFHAREVYAGSSVPFGDTDVVRGSVVARNGNTLTVRGATLVRADGTFIFNDNVTVALDPSAIVTKQLTGLASSDDISVGQRVMAFGALGGDIHANPTLDTTNGLVRMLLSSVAGTTTQVAPSLLQVSLQTINGRPVALYDFTGTGSDPASYRIATGGLSIDTIAAGDPVRVIGFPRPFGQATSHDFDAHTIIDLSDVPAWLAVAWATPSPDAFDSLSDTAMVIDLTESALHVLTRRGVVTDLTTLGDKATVQSRLDGAGFFVIVRGYTAEVYTTFANFSAALSEQVGTHPVHGVGARGAWNRDAVTLTSRFAVVRIRE